MPGLGGLVTESGVSLLLLFLLMLYKCFPYILVQGFGFQHSVSATQLKKTIATGRWGWAPKTDLLLPLNV